MHYAVSVAMGLVLNSEFLSTTKLFHSNFLTRPWSLDVTAEHFQCKSIYVP